MFSHIFKMLGPNLGTVLDAIATQPAASLAFLKKKRSFICIEDDIVIFRYLIGRTRFLATPAATMVELVEFLDSSEDENEGDKTGMDSIATAENLLNSSGCLDKYRTNIALYHGPYLYIRRRKGYFPRPSSTELHQVLIISSFIEVFGM